MLGLNFAAAGEPLRVLCLGAHADDIEIGCGGAMLRLAAEHPGMSVRWIVFSAAEGRRDEAESSARHFISGIGDARATLLNFRDGFFPSQHAEIKEAFEQLKHDYHPSLILTHHRADLHQDHRLVSELTLNTFRNHLIWEYEIPKYDGDFGNPNLFVPLSADLARRKVAALLEYFPSQHTRAWFTADTFLALLRLRGIGCNSPSGLAEGFYCHKAVI